jgi:GT2 family glycosyltransferase/glycosyltransferase involved in cell wall biosynthesis
VNPRAGPAKTQAEWFGEQAYQAWRAGQEALASGRLDEARRWLERALRLAPADAAAKLSLAVAMMRLGDRGAAEMFDEVARAHDVREAWLGLATARAEVRDWPEAAAAMASMLGRHVLPAAIDIDALARRIAHGAGAPGWCCVRGDGRLDIRLVEPKRGGFAVSLDGVRLAGRPRAVPDHGDMLTLTQDGMALLGSPLSLARMRAVEGFVEGRDGGLAGWAWMPANPEADPSLIVRGERGAPLRVAATDTALAAHRPMARPRGFTVGAGALAGLEGPFVVTASDGRELAGGPVDPGREARVAADVARAIAARFPAIEEDNPATAHDPSIVAPLAGLVGPPAAAPRHPTSPIAVIVPVYRDFAMTMACLAALRATMPEGTEVIVVDDASPEPDLAAALDDLAARDQIRLLRHAANLGFPASANTGLRVAVGLAGRPDVVLLNSDAMVTAGALGALRDLVHGAGDIGTATPLTNDGSILSYPDRAGGNPRPEGKALAALARDAARANQGVAIDIPTAVGFCMYIRRECLEQVGLFRDDVFGHGYGEENDFCIRARHLGWRHVAAPGVFVAHAGGRSFGASRDARIARNLAILERLHPGYRALIADHLAADPLAGARRALDRVRWSTARRGGPGASGRAAILVTHDSGGGVERVVRQRCETLRGEGMRPIVLRPVRDPDATSADARSYLPGWCAVSDGVVNESPNLRFRLPDELPPLLGLLRVERPSFVEFHHLLGHDELVLSLPTRLGIPGDVHVHDYAWFCPRITLLGEGRRYCGEPANPAVCEACIADLGRNDEQDISVVALRALSARVLTEARAVTVPSADAASRMRRHFPALRADIRGLEEDADLPPPRMQRRGARLRVCIVGAIGPEKGYDVVLACARDAAMRGLALDFVVVGHTIDDARLLATGRVFVTGPYREERAVAEIAAQSADVAFLPSIWPETWCFALGHMWRAGLRVAAFDIGAPAERIRRTGRGWLLPLGLPPASINNALLAARPVAGDECQAATHA